MHTEFLICSNALPAANIANVLANGIFPLVARPAAVPIISRSDIPISKNLSGHTFLNSIVFVALAKSASKTTTFSFSANSTKA